MLSLPEDVSFIINTLTANGYDAYAVGGCVRDSLMGVVPKDWDIAASVQPEQVKKLFSRTFDTGIKHGTVTVLLNRTRYEITTFRVDGAYRDGRRPSSVTFSRRIEDDLSRRDFTMNAVAYNPAVGFIDPHNGRGDIEQKMIRCVGRAEERFGEDALRMLRAVRFAAQLGFTVSPETLTAIPPLADKLRLISAERIREELTRILTAPYPRAGSLLSETKLLPYALRERVYGGDLSYALDRIDACEKHTAMVYALFLYWAGADTPAILRDLRFDNKTAGEIAAYTARFQKPLTNDAYDIKKTLRQLPPERFNRLIALKILLSDVPDEGEVLSAVQKTAADIVARCECFNLGALAVNGDDLANAGVPPGKATGNALEYLLDAVMRNPALNERDALLDLLRVLAF